MSDYGPRREATNFNFREHYGEENEVVYSDSGLYNLVYAESPAYEITATDVQSYVGEFIEDEATAGILRRVSSDITITDEIRRSEKMLIAGARNTFSFMDMHPDTQCTLDELSQKIKARKNYLNTLDARQDPAETKETKEKITYMRQILEDREQKIRALNEHFYNTSERRNDWPLKTAINGIARHRAAQVRRDETSASAE
jgi:hypothetical protein